MEAVSVKVERRLAAGTRASRGMRRRGKIPGVFYGPKSQSVPIALDCKEFVKSILPLGPSHLVRLEAPEAELDGKIVLVKEVQRHPVSGSVLHADFYEVDLTAKIRVVVPLHYTGKAIGVVQGGILQPIKREIEVECLPTDIPESIEVDVTELGVHGVLHVKDLALPANVVACAESGETLVTVLPPTVEEEKAVAEAAPAEAAAAEAEAAQVAASAEEGEEKGKAKE